MTKKRVLVVHASSDLYGSDAAALAVARRARADGWEVAVTVPFPGPLVAVLEADGMEVIFLDPLKFRRRDIAWPTVLTTPVRWWREWRRLSGLARRRTFDVVYTSTAPTTGGALLARKWKARHVYHVHEIFWYPRPLVAALERFLATSDAVVCCARVVAEQFHSEELATRTTVAYTGVDVPLDVPERRPFEGVASGRPIELICVARLNEWKGQETLVDAVAVLRSRGCDIRLTLVGDVYRDAVHHRQQLLDQIAALRMEGFVTLAGERRDALALVAQADVFVLPSRRPEPFGMALVEAMALGRPVIGTAAGGPLEIITPGVDGLLVPPGDVDALAVAVEGLVSDQQAAVEMAERGRIRACDFDLARMAETVVALFDA
ncbi:MAG TPA: glycosyltransferase family 4 protein [Acidimicrobiales bacterium]|nr:glycosyltransferase family 4 protein [Acidimicrobiales bacterium]